MTIYHFKLSIPEAKSYPKPPLRDTPHPGTPSTRKQADLEVGPEASHSLAWKPGTHGKAVLFRDGSLHTWPTTTKAPGDDSDYYSETDGWPFHNEYIDNHGLAAKRKEQCFWIAPDGAASVSEPYANHVQALDPNLKIDAEPSWRFASGPYTFVEGRTDPRLGVYGAQPHMLWMHRQPYVHHNGTIYVGMPGTHHVDLAKEFSLPDMSHWGTINHETGYVHDAMGDTDVNRAVSERYGLPVLENDAPWKFAAAIPKPLMIPFRPVSTHPRGPNGPELPFVYAPEHNTIFVGPQNSYHHELVQRTKELAPLYAPLDQAPGAPFIQQADHVHGRIENRTGTVHVYGEHPQETKELVATGLGGQLAPEHEWKFAGQVDWEHIRFASDDGILYHDLREGAGYTDVRGESGHPILFNNKTRTAWIGPHNMTHGRFMKETPELLQEFEENGQTRGAGAHPDFTYGRLHQWDPYNEDHKPSIEWYDEWSKNEPQMDQVHKRSIAEHLGAQYDDPDAAREYRFAGRVAYTERHSKWCWVQGQEPEHWTDDEVGELGQETAEQRMIDKGLNTNEREEAWNEGSASDYMTIAHFEKLVEKALRSPGLQSHPDILEAEGESYANINYDMIYKALLESGLKWAIGYDATDSIGERGIMVSLKGENTSWEDIEQALGERILKEDHNDEDNYGMGQSFTFSSWKFAAACPNCGQSDQVLQDPNQLGDPHDHWCDRCDTDFDDRPDDRPEWMHKWDREDMKPWEPGQHGKGFIYDGKPYVWQTKTPVLGEIGANPELEGPHHGPVAHELTRENAGVLTSQHAYIDPSGKVTPGSFWRSEPGWDDAAELYKQADPRLHTSEQAWHFAGSPNEGWKFRYHPGNDALRAIPAYNEDGSKNYHSDIDQQYPGVAGGIPGAMGADGNVEIYNPEWFEADTHWPKIYEHLKAYHPTPSEAYKNYDDPEAGIGWKFASTPTHYNNWGQPCSCTFNKPDLERTAGKLHDHLMNPKQRPDMQTPEGQEFLHTLGGLHNDKTDKLMPWLAREWKKGRLSHMPRKDPTDPADHGRLTYEFDRRDGYGPAIAPLRQQELDHWADFYRSNHPLKREMGDVMQHDIGSFRDRVEQWNEDMRRRAEEQEQAKHLLKGGQVVHTTPDGWTIRNLTTPEELKAEGDAMGHCVGGYHNDVESGRSIIHSLRDPEGKPHATIEYDPTMYEDARGNLTDDWMHGDEGPFDRTPRRSNIVQIQGKSNEEPKDEYKERIKHYFTHGFSDEDRPGVEGETISHIGQLDPGADYYRPYYDGDSSDYSEYGLNDNRSVAWHPLVESLVRTDDQRAYRNDDDPTYDPKHGQMAYELARKRGEIPEFAKAVEDHGQEWQQNFDDWREMNLEATVPYPQEEDYSDPDEYDNAMQRYEEDQQNWADEHPGMQAAQDLYGHIAPHYDASQGGYVNHPTSPTQTFSNWRLATILQAEPNPANEGNEHANRLPVVYDHDTDTTLVGHRGWQHFDVCRAFENQYPEAFDWSRHSLHPTLGLNKWMGEEMPEHAQRELLDAFPAYDFEPKPDAQYMDHYHAPKPEWDFTI